MPSTEGGVKAADRRTVLMLMYVIGALKPDVVDPEVHFLAKCTRKQWPLLIAQQLYKAEWPRDRSIPSRLLHAACPVISKILLSSNWAGMNITAAVVHLRKLRAGTESFETQHASATPLGPYGQFQCLRPHLHAVLSLVGYPQCEHEEGWSAALTFADAVWRAGSGYDVTEARRVERAVDTFMRAIFEDMASELENLATQYARPRDAPALRGAGAVCMEGARSHH